MLLLYRERMSATHSDDLGRDQPTRKLAWPGDYAPSPMVVQLHSLDGDISPRCVELPSIDINSTGYGLLGVFVTSHVTAPSAFCILRERQSVSVTAFQSRRYGWALHNEDDRLSALETLPPHVDEEFPIERPNNCADRYDYDNSGEELWTICF
jgi:hypothetical protein